MILGETGIVLPFAGGLLCDILGQVAQRAARLQGADIGLSSALEIVEPVEGLGHGAPDHQHAVIAHDQSGDLRVRQKLHAARGLVGKGHAAVMVIHYHAVVEHRGVLVDRGQTRIRQTGQHCGMDRMHMHGAARVRTGSVQAAMQAPGGGIGCIGPVHRRGIMRVDLDQAAGGDPSEMPPRRVDEETRPVAIHRKAEMIGHRLMHVQSRGPAKGGGHVRPLGPMGQVALVLHGRSP